MRWQCRNMTSAAPHRREADLKNGTGVQVISRFSARKAIWVVAIEVAVFNVLLAVFMLAIFPINRDAHMEAMARYLGLS